MVDDFFLRLWISSKRFLASDSVSLSRSHSSMISRTGLMYFFSTLAKVPESLAACRSSNRSERRTSSIHYLLIMIYLPHQRHSSIMRDGEFLNQKEPWPLSSALRPFCSAKPTVVGRYLHINKLFKVLCFFMMNKITF